MKVKDIGALIGNTPLLEISTANMHPNVKLYGKLEGHNPGGSVKDRPAYNMIRSAIDRGKISQNTKLVEATSGNTGIALAMVASYLGLDLTLIMPASATIERKKAMRAFGARLIETDPDKTIEYSRELAQQMEDEEGYIQLNQFSNPDNYLAHYQTTGPEIWRDTEEKITHFVSSMGTTGTIMGCSRFLKEKNKRIQIIGVQPEEGSRIPGIRKWTPEFLPAIYNPERVDEIRLVNKDQASHMARRMAEEWGIFAGMSAGGAGFKALELAENLQEPACIVFIVCDRGDRYLSSDLFN
ncbi:MAG TPA: cysteine synthase CysM [Saprospiraceae bacterium]|nr:cysteine synthase CysM [Saprospiraceae bacterium]